ncbi:cytochrome c maturation protein CcmE [Lentzea tibetensis]|uniref:Cytochrome c maturation protein CcmE n=1 Tax=Lentzea tibetensis TaxID=2591470 RepID=A0A563F1P7_9PSEU|nr:cytochrome c maturation protein CcmE [Lentzea tibetensis]TWP53833.1 cytochrome c maturation protein CcmE [Lentzea tibetensis]
MNPLDQPLNQGDITTELKQAKSGIGRTTIILGVAVLAVVAFVGGILVQKSFGSTANSARQNASGRQFPQRGDGSTPPSGANRAGGFGRGTVGTIDHVDGATIYVKTQNGTVVKVSTSDKTRVQVTQDGKLGDLKAGTQVVVQGQQGDDGSVTAQTVTQRPPTG